MFTASDESFIVLQRTLLTGVTNISFDQQINEEAVNLINLQGINRKIVNPTVTNCKIIKKYCGEDFLRSLTGFVGLSGQFIYGKDALEFNDAVISNYSLSMDSQSIPTVSADLKIYGDLKPVTRPSNEAGSNHLTLPFSPNNSIASDHTIRDLDANDVSFTFMQKTVPISNFAFNAAFNVKPTYEISTIKSSTVKIIPPVQLSTSVKMEMTEQEFENVTGFVSGSTTGYSSSQNLPIETGANFGKRRFTLGFSDLKTYDFSGFSLESQNVSISTRETVQLDSKYKGYLLNLPGGSPPEVPA